MDARLFQSPLNSPSQKFVFQTLTNCRSSNKIQEYQSQPSPFSISSQKKDINQQQIHNLFMLNDKLMINIQDIQKKISYYKNMNTIIDKEMQEIEIQLMDNHQNDIDTIDNHFQNDRDNELKALLEYQEDQKQELYILETELNRIKEEKQKNEDNNYSDKYLEKLKQESKNYQEILEQQTNKLNSIRQQKIDQQTQLQKILSILENI